MFGITKTGFLFPVKMRLKLDPATSTEFGVSGYF